LCTGHHTVKHHGGWTVHHIPHTGGALLWTSPAGRRYRVNPERPTPHSQPSDAAVSDAPF
ncbi:MAG: HNH endonuclease, partial [Microbacterium sp.]